MALKTCESCGAQIKGDTKFCIECGAPLSNYEEGVHRPAQIRRARPEMAEPSPDSPYSPIGTGRFLGVKLLMWIPLVNLILLIVWACGGCKSVNLRNFARASLVMALIGIVLLIIGYFLASPYLAALLSAYGV